MIEKEEAVSKETAFFIFCLKGSLYGDPLFFHLNPYFLLIILHEKL